MEWWDDLWLNEGFASWVQYIGVDHVHPEWKMVSFQAGSGSSLSIHGDGDSANNSPLSRYPVLADGAICSHLGTGRLSHRQPGLLASHLHPRLAP